MEIYSVEIEVNGKKDLVSGSTKREELIALFGQPGDIGGFSRKKKRGMFKSLLIILNPGGLRPTPR